MKKVLDVEAYRRGKIVVHPVCICYKHTAESLYILQIMLDVHRTLYFNFKGYQVDESNELMSEPTYLLLL